MNGTQGPHNLKVITSCFGCVMQEEGVFCHLSHATLSDLNSVRQASFYPKGVMLFAEGDTARGVFILCSGLAKLTISSAEGQSVTLRLVEAGEVLGLGSVIANEPYQASAETLLPCQLGFIPRLQFMQVLRAHADISLNVARHLTMELHKAWDQTRILALAPSTQAKVAQFLLAWAAQHGQTTPEGVHLALNMTHEEIGQAIGSSRESVSRALGDFRQKRLIRMNGGSMVILEPTELRSLSSAPAA